MKTFFLITNLLLISLQGYISAQVIILGSDPAQDIKVVTSSDYTPQYWTQSASGDKTINNVGLEGKWMEASRFLSQATLGADLETIKQVAVNLIETCQPFYHV